MQNRISIDIMNEKEIKFKLKGFLFYFSNVTYMLAIFLKYRAFYTCRFLYIQILNNSTNIRSLTDRISRIVIGLLLI